MGMHFTLRERSALFGLLAENSTDIILKTDRNGFILNASPAIERLGFRLPNLLIGPHIADLVHPSNAERIRSEHTSTLTGRLDSDWIEFPAQTGEREQRWFAIRMRALIDGQGQPYGALSMMRSIDEQRRLEDRLFAAEMTDPLTGLTNRPAFVAMLRHLVESGIGGCVALFDIDHFMAINMHYGQSAGDEVLVVFADLLRTMMRREDIISRVGGECLGVLLPRATPERAEQLCGRIIETLADTRRTATAKDQAITASAGIAPIANTLDDTLKRAELALFIAKAKGRSRLELDGGET